MRKLLIILTILGGLLAAEGVWSQDRREPEVRELREAREQVPRMGVPLRGESIRGDSMRAQPPVTFRTRPGHLMDDPSLRTRQLEDRQLQQLQRQLPQTDARDPRTFSYRTRPAPGEMAINVPHDMQRAIEKAQAEHGGKVLSADRIRYRGQDTYRVKLLTPGGRVRVVQLSEQAAPDAEANEDQRKGD
jgi:hypothetical protein